MALGIHGIMDLRNYGWKREDVRSLMEEVIYGSWLTVQGYKG